jgi:hypothetical protein
MQQMLVRIVALLGCAALSFASHGETPQDLLATWRAQARSQSPMSSFSAERGRALYFAQPADWSCTTCHTKDPQDSGRHAVTNKPIRPLSPLADPARFSDAAKVDKWFKRNCRDVLQRECTIVEKGDLLTFLMSQ